MLTKKYGEPEVCIEEFQTKIMQMTIILKYMK